MITEELQNLHKKADSWTLADDSQLITTLEKLVKSVGDREDRLHDTLSRLNATIRKSSFAVSEVNAKIGLYSASQFIEQRVMEDDYRPPKPKPSPPSMSLEGRQRIVLGEVSGAVREGLRVISTHFHPLDPEDFYVQYEPIDKFDTPVPPMIGSHAFFHQYMKGVGKQPLQRPQELPTIQEDVSTPTPVAAPSNIVSTSDLMALMGASRQSAIPPPPPDMPKSVTPASAAFSPSSSSTSEQSLNVTQPTVSDPQPKIRSIFDDSDDETFERSMKAPALFTDIAIAAAARKVEMEKKNETTQPPLPTRTPTVPQSNPTPKPKPVPPVVASVPQLPAPAAVSAKPEEKATQSAPIKTAAPVKKPWTAGKSIFEDSDSDDELFRVVKKPSVVPSVKKEEPVTKSVVAPVKVAEAPKKVITTTTPKAASNVKRSIFDTDSDDDTFTKSITKAPPLQKKSVPSVAARAAEKSIDPPPPTPPRTDPLAHSSSSTAAVPDQAPSQVQAVPPPTSVVPSPLTPSPLSRTDQSAEEAAQPVIEASAVSASVEQPVQPRPQPIGKRVTVSEDLFDAPPPFVAPREDSREETPEQEDLPSSSQLYDIPPPAEKSFPSDQEPEMRGSRAAFMDQLNAKLATKPPGMGRVPSNPNIAPSTSPTTSARSEQSKPSSTSPQAPLKHIVASRPRGPQRRPPTKRVTSSESEGESTKPATIPSSSAIAKASTKTPEAKISTKPPTPPISKSPDPLKASSSTASAVKTVPSTAKVTANIKSSTSPSTTPKVSATLKAPVKKSIFESDSDENDLFSSKTLPSKAKSTITGKTATVTTTVKQPEKKAAAPVKKSIFDDSSDDGELFKKK